MALTRREFLKTSVAAATAALAPTTLITEAQARDSRNLFDILKEFSFTDETGQLVNINALRNKLKDRYTTLSFGFTGCSTMCPLAINPNLATIGKGQKNQLTSIAINVVPESDGFLDPSGFRQSIEAHGTDQPVITLFPKSQTEAANIQIALNQFVNKNDPNAHTSRIFLFNPDGSVRQHALANANADVFQQWNDELTSMQRGR